MNDAARPEVRLVRRLDAACERAFDAWLDPQMIGQFMFGPALREEEVLRLDVDPRVGGAFSFLVRRQGTEIDHVGNYLLIDRPHRLAFTWGIAGESDGESRVAIEIVPAGEACDLTLVHAMQPKWSEFAGRVKTSWTRMLDALSTALTNRV